MPIEETKRVHLDDSTVSITFDGVPLSDDLTITERFEIYRKQTRKKYGLKPREETENQAKKEASKSGAKKYTKKPKTFPGPKTRKLLEEANEVYATTTRSSRICVKRGNGPFVIDEDDFLFFDFHCDAGVMSLGRGNDFFKRAIRGQLRMNNEFCEFHNAPNRKGVDLASLLIKESPVAKPCKMFFSNSGTEANEAAHKLCLAYRYRRGETGRTKIIYFLNGFAGRTAGNWAGTTSKPKVQRNPFWTHCDQENTFYLPYPRKGEDWILLYRHFNALPHEEIDRILIEIPYQGEGGIIPIEEEALRWLAGRCKEEGIIIISDCVQTGMGRVGSLFGCDVFPWFEPDILTLGKALGGGLPIGATIFHKRFDYDPGEHANTFGGGPMVMSSALAVYAEIKKILANGEMKHLESKIKQWLILFSEFPIVIDFRGMGGMWGIDFLNAEIRNRVQCLGEELVNKTGCGLRLLPAGISVLRIMPPLNTDLAILSFAMKMLGEVIDVVNREYR